MHTGKVVENVFRLLECSPKSSEIKPSLKKVACNCSQTIYEIILKMD